MLRILFQWFFSFAQMLLISLLFFIVFLLGICMALMALKEDVFSLLESWISSHLIHMPPPIPPEFIELKEDLEAMKIRMKQVEAENQSLLETHFQRIAPQANLSTRHFESITSRITKSLPKK